MTTKKKSAADHVIERRGFAEITLSRPASIEGSEHAVLRLREPTVEDMATFQDDKGSEAAREISMLANLCELPPAAIRSLPIRDYARLQAAFALFTN